MPYLYLLNHPTLELALPNQRPVHLMLYLAYQNSWISREELINVFSPEDSEANARHNLRVLISRAKRFEWAKNLEVEPKRLRWSIQTDVQDLQEAYKQENWAGVITLHQQPLLHNYALDDSPGLKPRFETERNKLFKLWKEAITQQNQILVSQERYEDAFRLLHKLLQYELLDETVFQHYLELAYRLGHKEEALNIYKQFSRNLKTSLDLEPLEKTRVMASALQQGTTLTAKANFKVPLSQHFSHPPKVIGRQQELKKIRAASSMVLIAGEPGSGKSRLLAECFPDERFPTARWCLCREGLENIPYASLLELVRSDLSFVSQLGAYRDDLLRLIPDALPDIKPAPADPTTSKERLLEALARMLEASPTPILIDDLQWADPATLEVLGYLLSRNKTRLIATYRSNEVSPALQHALDSWRNSPIVELELKNLNDSEFDQLITSLAGENLNTFSSWLKDKTSGNIFFALESFKEIFENKPAETSFEDWYKQLQAQDTLHIPLRVAQLIERRISRLSESTQRLIQTASVMREGFDAKVLAEISGASEQSASEALTEAMQAGILFQSQFRHDLFRQIVYQSLGNVRKRLMHMRVAEYLYNIATPLIIAEHWLAAEEKTKAFPLLVKAAEDFRLKGLLQESLSMLEQALIHAPSQEDALEQQSQQAYLELALNQFDKTETLLEAILSKATSLKVKARAFAVQAALRLYQGKITEAAQSYQKSETARLQAGLEPLDRVLGAEIAYNQQRYQDAIDLLKPAADLFRKKKSYADLANILTSLGVIYEELGENKIALKYYQEAQRVAEKSGSHYAEVNVAMNLVRMLGVFKKHQEAIRMGQHALSLGEYAVTSTLRHNLARELLALERYEEARSYYEININDPYPTLRCAAWGRLIDIYQHFNLPEEQQNALKQALDLIDQTEFISAHVNVAVPTLLYGSDQQVAKIRPYIEGKGPIEPEALIRLENALTKRYGKPSWP